MEKAVEPLLKNSKASQLACIEIHNKPIFPYRYEICVILNINAWELLLKAFIIKYHPKVKVINADGTTKPFEECLSFVASELGKEFTVIHENLNKIYEFRCNIIHFYQEEIDILLFGLLSKNILLYHDFLIKYFNIDLANETNLVLLPIGFKAPVNPIEFLSNGSMIEKSSKSVQSFVKSIMSSSLKISNEGIEDSILYSFKMALINENRIKNADVIAAITKDKGTASIVIENAIDKFTIVESSEDEGVKKVKFDEENLFKTIYTETYEDVYNSAKKKFSDFKQNNKFRKIMQGLKDNANFHKKRFLNVKKADGAGKDYYTKQVYVELAKYYNSKD